MFRTEAKMRIPGVKTAKRFSQWVRARLLGGAMILGYHRVTNIRNDAYDVCVTPDNFAQQMDALSKYANPVHLSQLIEHLMTGSLPPRTVAVTFDDGYADNLYQAKPILEKYGVPATIFVCSGYLGGEFWWDELERLTHSSDTDLQGLNLQAGNRTFKWNQPVKNREIINGQDVSFRSQFRQALYHFILPLDLAERELALEAIRAWARPVGVEGKQYAIDRDELLQLTEGGLVEVGSHTRNHLMLPYVSMERQREEILQGKQDLETLLGRTVAGFSYPNGLATHNAKQAVREAGFKFACISLNDVVRTGSDIHELTRFWQKDTNGNKFLADLAAWMNLS